MSISLQSIQVRYETRIRLVFTNTLASGAFGAPAPVYYMVNNLDGRAISPGVSAALLVPNSPEVVELVLDSELVKGALYEVSAQGVPASDTTTVPSGNTVRARWGLTTPKRDVEKPTSDRDLLLYFADLVWNGADFQKTANGDLDRVSGIPNVEKALNRRVEADGLPWDGGYGAKARDYVDSPSITAGTLRGAVASQMLQDPRVSSVRMSYKIEDTSTTLFADPLLVSGDNAEQLQISVPNQ